MSFANEAMDRERLDQVKQKIALRNGTSQRDIAIGGEAGLVTVLRQFSRECEKTTSIDSIQPIHGLRCVIDFVTLFRDAESPSVSTGRRTSLQEGIRHFRQRATQVTYRSFSNAANVNLRVSTSRHRC